MPETLPRLLEEIRACRLCAAELPCGPRPVLQAGRTTRLCIVGQAPGRKAHESGIPWDDASGERLRNWLGLGTAQFYDPRKVAIVPMGFCYPGNAGSGDRPPRPECAPLWHGKLHDHLHSVELTLLVGQYAQAGYLDDRRKATLTDTVKAWREYLAQGQLPLPHPSPRNQPWLAKNRWFETDLLPVLRETVRALGL